MPHELTKIDIKKIEEEIAYRELELMPILKENMSRARELGDLSENAEYRDAKRELNKNHSRIGYLKRLIKTSIIIDVVKTSSEVVDMFDKVKLYCDYGDETEELDVTVVTTMREDALNNYISKESPLGYAILGKKLNQEVIVNVNENYSYKVKILSIEKGLDDDSLKIREY